jgi:hypothetical protein
VDVSLIGSVSGVHDLTWLAWLDQHAGSAQTVVAFFILFATIAYVCFTIRLVRDQRRIQRAYISAEPEGLHPLWGDIRKEQFVVGQVRFRNGGHIPARKFRWYAVIERDPDPLRASFTPPPVKDFEGTTIIAPGSAMTFGTGEIDLSSSEPTWIYVWGAYTYDDGFVRDRRASFCHRYNGKALRKGANKEDPPSGHGISAIHARLHRYGNEELK